MPSPLDELRLSDDDKRRLYETWPAAMAACMSEQGYDMEIASSDATAGSRMLVRTPIDPVVVAEYGYHLPPEAALPDVVGANERRAQEDPAFMAALFGSDESSTDGCRGEQFDRVYDEDGDFWRLDLQIGNAQVELSIALDASQEMQQLEAEWSACMRDRGFAYEAPDRPASLYAGAATVTPEEIRTRHADVECQLQTRFVRTTSGWLAEAVDAWLEQNAETVAECLGLKDDHLRNLASIRQSLGMA